MTATKTPDSTPSTGRTTSRRSGARRPSPKPFTVDHFRAYARLTVLDNGEPFELEDFQLEQAADIFAGFKEIWLIQPEGTGKTSFLGLFALYHGDYTPSAFAPIAASSREQAEIMYRQAEGLVLRTPGMRDRFKCQEGYRRIKCLRTGGRIQVYAADDRTADGVIPSLALVDELHRHRDMRLYRTWTGKLEKRGGQIVTISTAGEPGSEFEEARERIRREAARVDVSHGGCHTRAAGEEIVLHDWSVPKRAAASDMAVVAEANPRRVITAEVLARKRASPTMTDEHWLRFVCNIATRAQSSPITPEMWDRLRTDDPVPEDLPTVGQIDLGWRIDTTAVSALVWISPEERILAATRVIEPPVDEADVVEAIIDIKQRFSDLRYFVYDPNAGGQQMVQMLEKGTHPLQVERGVGPIDFVEHSQDNAPMSLAASRFDEALRMRWLRWAVDGEWESLRRHVLNAARKDLGADKWRYDRPADAKGDKRRKYPIDALTAAVIGNSVAFADLQSSNGPLLEVYG